MVTLIGEQRERLVNALKLAFPSFQDMRMLVEFILNANIEEITGERRLEVVALDIIKHAERNDCLQDFIVRAQKRCPANPELSTFVSSMHLPGEQNAITMALSLLQPIQAVGHRRTPFPPRALLTSDHCRLRPRAGTTNVREELYLSPADAARCRFNQQGGHVVLEMPALNMGAPRQLAVRVVVDQQLPPGTVEINRAFGEEHRLHQESQLTWWLMPAQPVVRLEEAVIEMVVERENIEEERWKLAKNRQELLVDRCLLVEAGSDAGELRLPMRGAAYYMLRPVHPEPASLGSGTIAMIDEQTRLRLFVPHRKGGVDMVILVDVSASMTWRDFVDTDGQAHSRMRGVLNALQMLCQRRFTSGSRISHLAIVAYGGRAIMVLPDTPLSMIELGNDLQAISTMNTSLRRLTNDTWLDHQQVDRGHTDISSALQAGADLLNMCYQEGNEKIFLLLSDGAEWAENQDAQSSGEVSMTMDDPAVLAEKLHDEEHIRVYTVSISDEKAFKRWVAREHWGNRSLIPNTALLKKLAELTNGLYFAGTDAKVLRQMFDEFGRGTYYSLM